MRDDSELDRAIAQVARNMTDRAPRSGFATRVRERLESPTRHGRRRWTWWLVPIPAAAALVLWMALPRLTDTPTPKHPVPPTGGEALYVPPIPEVVTPRELPAPSAARRSQRQTRAIVPIPIDDGAPQIPAIAEVTELVLPAIEIADLSILPLEPDKEPR